MPKVEIAHMLQLKTRTCENTTTPQGTSKMTVVFAKTEAACAFC